MAFTISNEDHAVMAKRAARLMGREVAAPPSAPIPFAAPVVRAAPGKTANSQVASPEVKVTPPPPATTMAPATKENASPVPQQNAGPRLEGTAAQLAEAREFLQGATSGGGKARAGRQRLLSKDPGRLPFPSSSRSPRGSVTSLTTSTRGIPPMSTPPRGRPVARSQSSSVLPPMPAFGLRSENMKPASTGPMPTPANSPIQACGAFAANLTTKKESDVVKDVTDSLDKMKISHFGPPAASEVNEEGTKERGTKQLTDATNVANGRTADFVPPHLRSKANAQKTTGQQECNDSVKQVKDRMLGSLQDIAAVAAGRAKPTSSDGTFSNPTVDMEDTKKAALHANGLHNYSSDTVKKEIVSEYDILRLLKIDMEAAVKRITNLEHNNFVIEKQIEPMLQINERRKFLGTDSAKAPFAVEIKCPNGNTYKVQTSAGMKVCDLIRRVRVQADIAPTASKNPRLSVGGEQVGHGMTMGEAGIATGKMVVFSYDAAG